MDITGLVFVGLMILIGIVFFSILPVLTFFLYRHLRKKGKVQRNIGLVLFILTTLGMILLGIKIIISPSGFGPEYEKVEIKQKIGGKLLCNSVYNADIHSWQYDIDYKYVDLKGDTIDFKNGTYYGREWKKDEQLLKFNNFLILKTGAWYGSDRLIIKNIQTDSTKIFDIDDKFIEKDSLWKAQHVKSLLDYCCAETFIEYINGAEITVKYRFRTNEKLTKKYGERIISYQINNETGNIIMTKIK
jgi:hypothetical protein